MSMGYILLISVAVAIVTVLIMVLWDKWAKRRYNNQGAPLWMFLCWLGLGLIGAVISIGNPIITAVNRHEHDTAVQALDELQTVAETQNDFYRQQGSYNDSLDELRVLHPDLNQLDSLEEIDLVTTEDGDGLLIEYTPDGDREDQQYILTAREGYVNGRTCRNVTEQCQDGQWQTAAR